MVMYVLGEWRQLVVSREYPFKRVIDLLGGVGVRPEGVRERGGAGQVC